MFQLALVVLAHAAASGFVASTSRAFTPPSTQRLDPPSAMHFQRPAVSPVHATSSGTWVEVGPTNQAGPTQCATLDLGGTTLYLGLDEAGFFSNDPLVPGAWTPLGDNLGFGAHFLVVTALPAPSRPASKASRASVGEGERWLAASKYGLMRYSDDAGATWQMPTGLLDNMDKIKRVMRDQHGMATMLMLAHGDHDYGSGVQHGWHVLYSATGGHDWTAQYYEGDALEPDLWVPRVLLLSSHIYMISQGRLLISDDEGYSWDDHGALPATDDALLTGSEAGAPRLYAWQYGTIFRSDDLGTNWTPVQDVSSDRPTALCAAIDDPSLVVWGGYHAYHSEDGGSTVTEFPSNWLNDDHAIHEYILGIDCLQIPNLPSQAHRAETPARANSNTRRFYFHTLGGTWAWDTFIGDAQNMTRDNCPNVQAWMTRTSSSSQFSSLIGTRGRGELGTSDFGPGTPYPLEAAIYVIGPQVVGNVASSVPDHSTAWTDFGSLWCLATPSIFECQARPADPSPVEFGPFLANPSDPQSVYWGGESLWKVTRIGTDLYQQIAVHNFSSGEGDVVTAFAIAPGPGNVMYVGTRNGRHFYSHDFGGTWTQGTGVADPFVSSYAGMGIAIEPGDSTKCWMGGSHGTLWFTLNEGQTWYSESIGIDANVWSLAFDNPFDRRLYAATDAGPYMRTLSGWVPLAPSGSGVPVVPFFGVESLDHAGRMRFATFGRGVWDYETGSTLGVPVIPSASKVALSVYPNPLRGPGMIEFSLPSAGHVRIDLLDIAGRRVRSELDADRPAGPGAIAIDERDDAGRELADGLYLVRLATPTEVRNTRFMLLH